jgi:tetratricopeptide (TPR) repeat protein
LGRPLVASLLAALLSLGLGLAQESATTDGPGTSSSLLSESAQRLSDGDFEGAIRDASLALQLDPKNPAGYEALGSIYIQEKLWDRAESNYTLASKLSPDPVYKYKLAEIKFLQKDYEDARPLFLALKDNASLGELAFYKAFLCDLLSGHDSAAAQDLAERDRAPSGPSLYFTHAAWDLFHSQKADAAKYFNAADHLYDHSVTDLYISSLIEVHRFQVTTATFTDRSGASYNNASVFLESAGLRVSTKHGWVTLPLDQLPDDLSAFPEDLREQIDRKRAVLASASPPTILVSFTTKSGQTYDQVRWALEDTGLSVLTPDGWTSLPFGELPADLSVFPPELQEAITEKLHVHPTTPLDSGVVTFTTKQGKSYAEVEAKLGSDGVHVLTSDGWLRVAFRDLPNDVSSFPADWQPEIQTRRATAPDDVGIMQVVSFTTKRGLHYDEVRAALEKGGLRLVTSDGLVAVPFNELPADLSPFPEEWRETIATKESEIVKDNNTSP